MGHLHGPDGAHTHGSSGGEIGAVFDGLATVLAVAGGVIIAAGVVMWVLHILAIVAEGIGFTVMAAAGGFLWWKARQAKLRRQHQPPFVIVNQPAPQQFAPAPAPIAELPQRGGDIHLHLAPGMQPADVAAVIREQQRQPQRAAELGAELPRQIPGGWQ